MTILSRRVAAAFLLGLLAPASAAVAQVWIGSRAPRPGTVELSVGGSWSSGQDFDGSAASLTRNPTTGTGSFDLFVSDPSIAPAFGGNVAVGVYVTRAIAIEGGFQYSRPEFRVRLSGDVEDAPDLTATTRLSQYLFTGSLLYHFGSGGRTTPFVAGGAGHVRDAHVGNGLVETGTEFHGKAGVKAWFGRRRTVGLRVEGGVSVRDGGFNFEDGNRIVPMAAASMAFLF